MFAILLAAAALAAPPVRCEAVFSGPSSACALSGEWSTTGTGKNEATARRNAERRLATLIESAVERQSLATAGTMAAATSAQDALTCGEAVADQARVFCYEEPSLSAKQLCFADLKRSSCWREGPINTEAPGWRAMELGRAQLCEQVDRTLVEDDATLLDRLSCQVECLQETQVRCIDGG